MGSFIDHKEERCKVWCGLVGSVPATSSADLTRVRISARVAADHSVNTGLLKYYKNTRARLAVSEEKKMMPNVAKGAVSERVRGRHALLDL